MQIANLLDVCASRKKAFGSRIVNANCNCIQPLHDLGWGGVLTTLQTWDIWAGTTRWAGSKSGEHADWPLLTVGSD